MDTVDPDAFEYAMLCITDGKVFERFAQDLLCQIIGEKFKPIGGRSGRSGTRPITPSASG